MINPEVGRICFGMVGAMTLVVAVGLTTEANAAVVFAKPSATSVGAKVQYKSNPTGCDDASGWTDKADLQTALAVAGSGGKLFICSGSYAGTMINASGGLNTTAPNQTVEIAPGASVFLDGTGIGPAHLIALMHTGATLNLRGATLRNGAPGYAHIRLGNTVAATVNDGVILAGQSGIGTAGVILASANGNLTINRTVFKGSTEAAILTNAPGAVVNAANIVIVDSYRALYHLYGAVTINNATILSSGKAGGQIHVYGNNAQTLTINNSLLGSPTNAARAPGYAIYAQSTNAQVTVNNSLILPNPFANNFPGLTFTNGAIIALNNCITNTNPRFVSDRRQAVIIFSVDDDMSADWAAGLATKLEAYGWKLTWYVTTQYKPDPYPGPVTASDWNNIQAIAARGQEIGSHSQTHSSSTSTEFSGSKADIIANVGVTPLAYAYPGTLYDENAKLWASQNYLSARAGDATASTSAFSSILAFNMFGKQVGAIIGEQTENGGLGPTEADIRGRIASVCLGFKTTGGVLNLYNHDGVYRSILPYEAKLSDMDYVLDEIAKCGAMVMTHKDAIAYIASLATGTTGTGGNLAYQRSEDSLGDAGDYRLQPVSSLIDAGTGTFRTTDAAGNPIYGAPDIGAYEYQPPHVMGVERIDIVAGARIYGDGKFRDMDAVSGNTADLTVAPAGGSFPAYGPTAARPQWMDITITAWDNTGAHHKQWSEASSIIGSAATLHTVGDLDAGKWYSVSVDVVPGQGVSGTNGTSCSAGACLSNAQGRISFLYSGGYSGHTFDVAKSVDTSAPDFSLSAALSALAVPQGGAGTTAVSTAVQGGFNSAISLSASGLPAGASAAFARNPLAAPGTGSTLLTVTAGASAPAGTYPVTITASGGNVIHSATVSLVIQQIFSLTSSVVNGSGGSITPAAASVLSGGNAVLAVSPSTGYHLVSITDNGIDVTASVTNGTYTIMNVTANHALTAAFALNTYSVIALVSGGSGSITPVSSTVSYGSPVTLTITPGGGYVLAGLTDNGAAVGATASGSGSYIYTIASVTASQTIHANFSVVVAAPVPALGVWGMIAVASILGIIASVNGQRKGQG